MVKRYEKQTKQVVHEVLVERKCDLCGRTAKTDDWEAGCYTVDETDIMVTILQKDGKEYPEGGSGTRIEVDLCPDCFKDRLVPWLRSEGAAIEPIEWSW